MLYRHVFDKIPTEFHGIFGVFVNLAGFRGFTWISRRPREISEALLQAEPPRIDRFHCHATKKFTENSPVEKAKKMRCYERLIFKQLVQVSGLCGPQFLSHLPKCFTHLCRTLYGNAILVHGFGAPIWPPKINKNIRSSLFLLKLFLFTRKLAYVRINTSSNT